MSCSPQDHVLFWRTLGEALKAGAKLVEALAQGRSRLAATPFEQVAESLTRRLQTGQTFSHALRELPEVFDERIAEAMRSAEEAGVVDVVALQIAAALEAGDLAPLVESAPAEPAAIESRPVIGYVNRLIRDAFTSGASDIHLDSTEDGRGRVRVRIDGALRDLDPPPEGKFRRVVDRFKVMAAMNTVERRLPQDGRCMMEVDGRTCDLRISTVPALYGERLVARILDRRQIRLGLPEVGLGGDDLERVRRLCSLPSGLVIVSGPAGSGKTTLLYSMLLEINRPDRCIITVEDPVEYLFEGIAQVQINPRIGWTYAAATRQLLRQAPNVVMVGELRDLEMMQLAAQVAITGHLLLTTMHTNSAVDTVARLLDCGLDAFMINSALGGVIATRLVRTLCGECKAPAEPAAHCLPPEAVEAISSWPDAAFCRPVGCEHCRGSGYRGRTGIFEVLIADDPLREVIAGSAGAGAMREAAAHGGTKTLLMAGMEAAARGLTSVEEVLRVVPLT